MLLSHLVQTSASLPSHCRSRVRWDERLAPNSLWALRARTVTGLGSHGCVAEFPCLKVYLVVLGSPGLGGAPGTEFGGFSLEFRGRLHPKRALPSEVPSFSVVSPLPRCCSFGNGHLQTGQKPPCSPVPSAGQAEAAGDAGGCRWEHTKLPGPEPSTLGR